MMIRVGVHWRGMIAVRRWLSRNTRGNLELVHDGRKVIKMQDVVSRVNRANFDQILDEYLCDAIEGSYRANSTPPPFLASQIYTLGNRGYPESELGNDGYPNIFSPKNTGSGLLRRLWAKGNVSFTTTTTPFQFPDPVLVECQEQVHHVDYQHSHDKMTVWIERNFTTPGYPDPFIREERAIVYIPHNDNPPITRQGLAPPYTKVWDSVYSTDQSCTSRLASTRNPISNLLYQQNNNNLPTGYILASHTLIPTEILTFKFSALSYNTHKIHYDSNYARNVEHYPNIIVHGPLIITLALDWALRTIVPQSHLIDSYSYSHYAPIFIGQTISFKVALAKHQQQEQEQEHRTTQKYVIWVQRNDSMVFKMSLYTKRSASL